MNFEVLRLTHELAQGDMGSKTSADGLAEALLPVLIHSMNNATQLMANLSTLARSGQGSSINWIESRADDLLASSREIDRVGYMLAVLASASGAELLGQRRVPEGLAWMTAAVAQAVRREGGALAEATHPVPLVRPGAAHGWEVCWAAGALLRAAAVGSSRAEPLEWQWLDEGDSWVLVCAGPATAEFKALGETVTRRLPEAELDLRSEGWSWRLPAAWLEAAGEF
ncbi:MAG: hypothetical protein ABGY71_11495 [bacterium]|jgi:hypothetical protein|nr:hypothetical protein [Planctomycetota bacterium]